MNNVKIIREEKEKMCQDDITVAYHVQDGYNYGKSDDEHEDGDESEDGGEIEEKTNDQSNKEEVGGSYFLKYKKYKSKYIYLKKNNLDLLTNR